MPTNNPYKGATPLPLAEALQRLAKSRIPESSLCAIQSTVRAAVHHLARARLGPISDEALLNIDVQPYLPVLHVAARDVAVARGHQHPGEHASRAARGVELLTGMRPTSPRFRYACPPAFQPLLLAKGGEHVSGSLGYIAKLCTIAGVHDAPARLPDHAELFAAAERLAAERSVDPDAPPDRVRLRKRVRDALTRYRIGRAVLLSNCKSDGEREEVEAKYAPIRKQLNDWHACHVGMEPAVHALLLGMGYRPQGMTPYEMLRVVNPELVADYEAWISETRAKNLSGAYRKVAREALLRVAGWAVRAGRLETLRSMHGLDDFFALSEELPDGIVMNSRAARRIGATGGTVMPRVISLLEFCAEDEAVRSLQRSTVTTPDVAGSGEGGRPWFTDAICADCDRIWSMTRDLYKQIATQGAEGAARWGLITARHTHLYETLEERRLPPQYRITAKDKLLMIRTVTLPQLVCVGLPLRRREAHRLRDEWQQARQAAVTAGHAVPDEHFVVHTAFDAYMRVALPLTILSVAVDDGLRVQQYTHGCLGFNGHFRPDFARDERGLPTGLRGMVTRWAGDIKDPAHLKIVRASKRPALREERDLRPGVVDMNILWDVISLWRPRQLFRAQAIPSVAGYDLVADMQTGLYSLFPTDSPSVTRNHRSRTDISAIIGYELYTIVRTYLRPALPDWDKFDDRWRSLWAAHILRLLNGSYWGGVRDLMDHATLLTMDTKYTLEKEYIAVDKYMSDRMGLSAITGSTPTRTTSTWMRCVASVPSSIRSLIPLCRSLMTCTRRSSSRIQCR